MTTAMRTYSPVRLREPDYQVRDFTWKGMSFIGDAWNTKTDSKIARVSKVFLIAPLLSIFAFAILETIFGNIYVFKKSFDPIPFPTMPLPMQFYYGTLM